MSRERGRPSPALGAAAEHPAGDCRGRGPFRASFLRINSAPLLLASLREPLQAPLWQHAARTCATCACGARPLAAGRSRSFSNAKLRYKRPRKPFMAWLHEHFGARQKSGLGSGPQHCGAQGLRNLSESKKRKGGNTVEWGQRHSRRQWDAAAGPPLQPAAPTRPCTAPRLAPPAPHRCHRTTPARAATTIATSARKP